jgi:ABC-type dipeptide/oligopeptide/nickel transport system ATPase component
MRILEFEFENKVNGWRLSPVKFDDLNLLVGVSGVGKTQILLAIMQVRSIAGGRALIGRYWKIRFLIDENEYLWEGEFDKSSAEESISFSTEEDDELKEQPRIVQESLFINNTQIITRDKNNNINVRDKEYSGLANSESIVHLMRDSQDSDISNIREAFKKIIHSDQVNSTSQTNKLWSFDDFDSLKKKYNSLEKIKSSSWDIPVKLLFVLENPALLNEAKSIKESFQSIFNQVEDIKFDWIEHPLGRTLPILTLKEKDIHDWVGQDDISSGMFRTLMHIAELYLLPDHSVVLIDEFENSLGVNCLSQVTENILSQSENQQFIITSHHPYVINNIDFEYWKIVTRKGNIVKIRNSSEFNLGDSKHTAFTKLMNLEEYEHGVQS